MSDTVYALYRFHWKDGYVDCRKVNPNLTTYKRHYDDRDDRAGVEGWLTFALNRLSNRGIGWTDEEAELFFPGSQIVTFRKDYHMSLEFMVFMEV